MKEPLDDRTFESVVPVSEEQAASQVAHFKDKGYEVETQAATPETPPAVPAEPAKAPEVIPAADAKPADAVVAPTVVDEVDAETRTEFEETQKQNDGEKLSRQARKNKEIRELRAKTAADDARIRELEEKVRTAPAAPPAPGSGLITAPPVAAAPPAEPAKPAAPEAPKAKEFDKPEPVAPKYDDFSESDDPTAAFNAALVEYTKKYNDYQWDKRDFASAEAKRVQDETTQQTQQQDRELGKARTKEERIGAAKTEFADFDTRTNAATYTPVLKYVCLDRLADGPRLAYLLALPENAEVLKAIVEKTKGISHETPGEQQNAAIDETIAELAVFRHSLKSKAAPAAVAPPAAPAPGTAAAPPAVPAAPQTPSAQPTTGKVDPAPTSVRGRTATTGTRIEDIDSDDSDTRRDLRKRGQLLTT